MGHPFADHREHKVQKDRVSSLHGYATGGAVAASAPARATGGAVAKKAAPKQRMAGGAVKARLDRKPRATGGRAKHKGKTVVNVNVASHPGMTPAMPAGGPPMAGPPMMPPHPPMAPPMAGPPGAMPPGMPPGGAPMGIRSKGGKVKRASGGKVKRRADGGANDDAWEAPMTATEKFNADNRHQRLYPNDPSNPGPLGNFVRGMKESSDRAEEKQSGKRNPIASPRARGGSVKDGPTWKEGLKSGTQVSDGHGQSDIKDIGRGKAMTYNKGGSVPQTPAGSGIAPKSARQPRASGGKAMAPGFTIKEAKGARGIDRLGVEMTEGGGPKMRGGAAEGLGRLDKIKLYGGK